MILYSGTFRASKELATMTNKIQSVTNVPRVFCLLDCSINFESYWYKNQHQQYLIRSNNNKQESP